MYKKSPTVMLYSAKESQILPDEQSKSSDNQPSFIWPHWSWNCNSSFQS